MNENKTISGDDVLEMSRQQFSNETYSEFLKGKKQGALEELKKALLLSTTLNDKDIESYLNHRIKELEGCEKNVIVK